MTLEARLVQKLAALTSSLSQCVRLVWLPAPQLVVVRFSETEIVHILSRVRAAMGPSGRAFILEPFWDQQDHEVARFCVIGTSLSFACIANGNSRMYHSKVMLRLINEAGLRVVGGLSRVGLSHSLVECVARG